MSVNIKERKGNRTGDLSFPDPAVEARSCLRVARASGDFEKMRETIRITPDEERALRRMSDHGQLTKFLVWTALEYRSAVLAEFGRLVAVGELTVIT